MTPKCREATMTIGNGNGNFNLDTNGLLAEVAHSMMQFNTTF